MGLFSFAQRLWGNPFGDGSVLVPATCADTGMVAVHDVQLALDTAIYADGDILAIPVAVANFFPVNGGARILQSVVVQDDDDQGVALDLLFFASAVALGAVNAAPTISDAAVQGCLGKVSVAASDYIDLGGCRVADVKGVGLVLQAAAGSATLYVAAITRGGTPTYTAAGMRLKLGAI